MSKLDDLALTGYDETLPISSRKVIDVSDAVTWESELVSVEKAAKRYAEIVVYNDRVVREELSKGIATRAAEVHDISLSKAQKCI